jgi:antitoxin YefM
MPRSVSITEARRTIGPLFSDVVGERRPALIERRNQAGLLVGEDDAVDLLSPYEFHTEVLLEGAAVSFWVPELALYGRGSSYEEAAADLVDEVREYIDEYWAEIDRYRQAPNRADHFPYLFRAHLADRHGRLLDVLLAQPSEARHRHARDELVAPA